MCLFHLGLKRGSQLSVTWQEKVLENKPSCWCLDVLYAFFGPVYMVPDKFVSTKIVVRIGLAFTRYQIINANTFSIKSEDTF